MNPKPRVVTCPICEKPVSWTPDNIWRPFCSERCKLIDLGAWASEKYRVPVVEDKDELDSPDPGDPPTAR
jgi:endogenous inhibitor of DNA gyrase (YacG/DUF329 family)